MPGGGGMGMLGQLLGGMGGMGGGGGRGGMGGMGGGGGRGGMGGMGQNQNNNQNSSSEEETIVDEYDVDRWKRADDDDLTNIEQVRADWDKKEEKKKSRFSFLKKKKKNEEEEDPRYVRRSSQGAGPSSRRTGPPGGMPGQGGAMAPGQETTQQSAPDPEVMAAATASAIPFEDDFQTRYERFFSANPLNSSILAMDELSMGPLTLNQVGLTRDQKRDAAAAMALRKEKEEESFMEARKQAMQQRQYEVHIVGEKRPNRMI